MRYPSCSLMHTCSPQAALCTTRWNSDSQLARGVSQCHGLSQPPPKDQITLQAHFRRFCAVPPAGCLSTRCIQLQCRHCTVVAIEWLAACRAPCTVGAGCFASSQPSIARPATLTPFMSPPLQLLIFQLHPAAQGRPGVSAVTRAVTSMMQNLQLTEHSGCAAAFATS